MKKNSKEVLQTEETIIAPSTKQIKVKALTQEIYNAVIVYLDTRPHNEVRNLIDALSQSPNIDVNVNEPSPSN